MTENFLFSLFSDVVYDYRANADAGVSHLVPNRPRTRRTILQRPAAPLTPIPLGDSVSSNGPENERKRKRPLLSIRTTPPVVKESEGSSTELTATLRPRFDPMRVLRNSVKGKQLISEDVGVDGDGYRWKGKAREESAGNRPKLERKESKISSKAREIREWMKGKSGLDIHRSTTDPRTIVVDSTRTRQTVGGVRDLFKSRRKASRKVGDLGPKPGQTYEIVERRVIENNPERTVEISTWREHSERKGGAEDEETMSIYYISADEYAQEGEFATTNSQSKRSGAEDSLRQRAKSSKELPFQQTPRNGPESVEKNVRPFYIWEGDNVNSYFYQGQTGLKEPNCRGYRSERGRTVISKSQENEEFCGNNRNEAFASARSRTTEGNRPFSEENSPGSPIPTTNSAYPPRPRGSYKQSTPIEKDLPNPPFHPTRSGSTISSIKSEATIQFEAILASCEPSLVHIAPLLRNLGIRKVGHLKAIARLTPPTRDREVKEDAFRQGITVMEWAILVDKISML